MRQPPWQRPRAAVIKRYDTCTQGGYGIYGCLANGENVLLGEGHWFNMTHTQRDLFLTQFGMKDEFICGNMEKTLSNCGK